DEQHHGGVRDADEQPAPDASRAPIVEQRDVEEREDLPIDQMDEKTDPLRFLAPCREHRAEQVGDAHARQARLLAALLDRGEDEGGDESGEQPAAPARAHACAAAVGAARGGASVIAWQPGVGSCNVSAALRSLTCVYARG